MKENHMKEHTLLEKAVVGSVLGGCLQMAGGFLHSRDRTAYKIGSVACIVGTLAARIISYVWKYEKEDEMAELHEKEAKAVSFDLLSAIISLTCLISDPNSSRKQRYQWNELGLIINGFLMAASGMLFCWKEGDVVCQD